MSAEREVCRCEPPVPRLPNYGQWFTVTDDGMTCNLCGKPANDDGWRQLSECVASIPACQRIYAGLKPEDD